MKIVTVEIIKDEAIRLLEDLQRLNIIRLLKHRKSKTKLNGKKKFKAVTIDTRNFKFNREEANER